MDRKVYFLAPTRHSPPDGPIALGNVIEDPRSPEIALNSRLSKAVREMQMQVHETVELNQSRTLDNSLTVQPSVWAKFVNTGGFVDVGADVGAKYSRTESSTYTFGKIVTREISPDLAAVRALFAEPEVQEMIKDRRWSLVMFMITGVQIAYGAEVVLARARERGVHFQTGVDLTPAGVPVSVGAGLEVSRAPGQELTTSYETPFVFAYRLRQIVYRKKKVEKQRDYVKGDLHGVDQGDGAGGEQDGVAYEAELDGLQEEDEELPEAFDFNVEEVDGEDGVECFVAYA
ncbi:uncharacterized protein DNG_06044 [Cephalotrichum gorgonifer]|uniref:Uncharacterized protein n=1 Tax=Cephalotrichum gorgonifer TaxID=2041049 RepID=A0AAE8SW28_9PEZI|nr:uncharacterized protein DNG_06044 [Cephalotrichum gorgonifer]